MKALVKTILYQPLFNALIFLVWLIPGNNVAWAIIGLTLIIRLILLPSTMQATRQQKKMKDLQPEIQALQEKYKGDKQKQAQVLMEFYKSNNINPIGSCLPLLIQLPILLVLYYVFLHGLDVSRFDLLYSFTPRPEEIKTVFLGIDLAKPDRFILPIIAGVLQFIQTWQITPKSNPNKKGDMTEAFQKQAMYMMPLFTIFIAGRLPGALPLYWIVQSLFSIVQQWWVLNKTPKTKAEKVKSLPKSNEPKTFKKGGVEVTVRRKNAK